MRERASSPTSSSVSRSPRSTPTTPMRASRSCGTTSIGPGTSATVHAESQLNFMNPDGLDRRVDVEIRYMNYDGVPADDKAPNPQNLLTQSLAVLTSPSDVSGTAALTWRYRDPDKRDSAWSYVPALRRVRAGQPRQPLRWLLRLGPGPGRRTVLRRQARGLHVEAHGRGGAAALRGSVEPGWESRTSNGSAAARAGTSMWPDIHFLGYMDPAWKGIAWAPVTPVLAKRRFYVVEGVPKDRYYLFGKLQMYIDTIAFQGAWNRKFNWQDELLITVAGHGVDALQGRAAGWHGRITSRARTWPSSAQRTSRCAGPRSRVSSPHPTVSTARK